MTRKLGNFFKVWLKENRAFVVFIALMCVFRSAVADWNDVPTGSMKPTIVEGDRIFINKMAYDLRVPFTHISLMKTGEPAYGDIVIFDSKAADERLVKRVIGLPGDTVAMQDNLVFINGHASSYQRVESPENVVGVNDYIEQVASPSEPNNKKYVVRTSQHKQPFDSFNTVTVPKDHYLVLGDNRDNSADSRFIGFVPREEIVGKSQHVAFSLNYDNYYLPRLDRLFKALDSTQS
ncbi:signal peptidase I [Thalassotalea euphylliae]|uniref:Signal peptidase I n=1 Tax=Thalassotalea euphylliae TaxID=1655234 RepID=A0A3E0TSU3_9GAMM|nr:signal peptidase I [Thalassotalea euphylliae]REL27480.1 signal peptidase I [Thalassotalea euphylliae]